MPIFRRIGAVLGAAFLGLTLMSPPAQAATVDLAGTINVGGCSGALVRTPSGAPDDPALIMTNGHCYEGAGPVADEVLVDRPAQRAFDLLDAAGEPVASLFTARAVYVTLTGTDIALYRLNETYRQLEQKYRVRPLTLSSKRPQVGTDIKVISGSHRKIFSCGIGKLVYRVLETGNVTKDVIRYTRKCDTGPGTSGSPIVDAATGQVVGINNTSNREGGRCTLDNPCEMDRDGVISVHKNLAYGTQTYWLTTCVGAGGKLDLGRAGCLLPRPGPRS
ncbi:serine protease [Spongiactinospora rosea]|uniref:Serine protease n=1 Tax=Spongiactinospora rosea TaxID=2248750 RepID=A0A366LTV9_9ACTN|nr:serine protease [Spongiactinospora rosea]RBQ17020.1 serine protease [Spongiactinospora rosea]